MGLIKEPRDVDFFVIDKPWSEKELKEFSDNIKLRKDLQKKRSNKSLKSKLVLSM